MALTKRALLATTLIAASGAARAQAWPAKPLRLIVPLAPGATADIVARMFAEELGKSLGQTVVVDNKTGAGGTIATAEAARAPADGYTMVLVSQGTMVFNMGLYKAPGYDSLKDLDGRDGDRRRVEYPDRPCRQSDQDGGGAARPGTRQAGRAHLFVGRRRHQPSHVGRAARGAHWREAAARALPRHAGRHSGGGQRRGACSACSTRRPSSARSRRAGSRPSP